jgi:hypothetical protein
VRKKNKCQKQKQAVQLGTEEIQSLNDLVQKFLMAKKSLLVLSLLGKEEQKFIQETKIHPGNNVQKGGDDTLYAKVNGTVKYSTRNGRKLVNIIP